MVRDMWQQGVFEAPSAVSALMLDAMDGKVAAVRRQLAELKPGDAVRWRQLAMLTAAHQGQSAMVEALLDDGASVDGVEQLPPFKATFYQATKADMANDPRVGGPATIKKLETAGVLSNRAHAYGPALIVAVGCDDLATLDVLLRHHAKVAQREAPNVADALTVATIGGDAAVVQRLLNHGADSCAFDRHAVEFHREQPTRPMHRLAQIGRRTKLPAALIARLTCPAITATR